MFRIDIADLAWQDFEEAYYWYEEKRRGLGDDLSLCFDECLEVIQQNPFFEVKFKGVRILKIRRFPYQVIYTLDSSIITVIAFFHAYRNPSIWQERIG